MEKDRTPKPGEIYDHFKGKPYQIITVATHTETGERMVVYQALYGEFKTFVRPLSMFISEVDKVKYPQVTQKYRFELRKNETITKVNEPEKHDNIQASECNSDIKTDAMDGMLRKENTIKEETEKAKEENENIKQEADEDGVNAILLKFLDASSYTKKLEIVTSNTKNLTDRLINDMAVSLDCTVEEGPLEGRIQGLVYCLQAMRRFEDRRRR